MKKELKISAIKDGTVIDHIPAENAFKAVKILNLDIHTDIVSVATNLSSKKFGKKCIIKIGEKVLTQDEVNKIAIIAPEATVNIIENYNVKDKIKVNIPNFMENIARCPNPACITNNERIKTKLSVLNKKPLKVKCDYCERVFGKDIELI